MIRRSRPGRPRRRTLPAALVLASLLGAVSGSLAGAAPASADSIREQQQWALDAINAPEAWRTTRGEGVTVAVLDTGVDADHPDLEGAVSRSKDLVGMGAGPGDAEWAEHGTAMAGIIAGRGHGPDSEDGVLGVAPEAKILSVRVLLEDDDPARDRARRTRGDALAEGIRWATDHGADVINLSLGDDSASAHPDPEEDAAVRYALRKGVVVVASAGNGGQAGDPVSYPAGYPGVIAVTAVDRTGSATAFSTERWYATVCAPGKDVIVPGPDDRYYSAWGTSSAAAFVSGTVALLLSAHPGLKPAEVKRLLTQTAQDPPEGGRDDARGSGLVDAAAAIEAAAGSDASEGGPPASGGGQDTPEYFGAGPRREESDAGGTAWLAPVAAVLGVLMLATAAVLFAAARNRAPATPRPG